MKESVGVVCPHCGTLNVVPPGHLGEAPKCSRCHHPLPVTKPTRSPTGNPSDAKEND